MSGPITNSNSFPATRERMVFVQRQAFFLVMMKYLWVISCGSWTLSNAFPNATLDEEIYMYPPAEMGLPQHALLRLLKALYGLKQASRLWHALISQLLIEFGFSRLRTHPCIFFMRNDAIGRLIIIALYFDDFTIASKLQEGIDELLRRLREQLQITDGHLEHILGFA